jgi:excisionase family DNA binding protein
VANKVKQNKTLRRRTIMNDFSSQKPMSVVEASVYLGYSKAYLYKLIHEKKIPYYKPEGGRVFFKQAELEQFIFRGRKSADYELVDRADALLVGRAENE